MCVRGLLFAQPAKTRSLDSISGLTSAAGKRTNRRNQDFFFVPFFLHRCIYMRYVLALYAKSNLGPAFLDDECLFPLW